MAVAAAESAVGPRKISCKGAKQAVTAFAPKIEAARPEDRARLIEVMLTAIAYHRAGDRPGRWGPRARKRRPKPGTRLTQPRATARLPQNRPKYYQACSSRPTHRGGRVRHVRPLPFGGQEHRLLELRSRRVPPASR